MRNFIYRLNKISSLAGSRLRAHFARLQGANIGEKCLIDRGFTIEYPWKVNMGIRCIIEPFVWFKLVRQDSQLSIGDYTFIGRGTEFNVRQSIIIGNNVLISPNVFITDHVHNTKVDDLISSQGCRSARVIIDDDVWLGVRSVVLPGVRIGHGAVVGAGAIVTHDVPNNAIVAGVPAKILRYRYESADEI